jgi:hypothetical protein
MHNLYKKENSVTMVLFHLFFSVFSFSFYIITSLQKASTEDSADEHNSSADNRGLAHVADEQRVGSSAGRSSRSRASLGSTGRSVRGNSGHTAGTGLSSGGRLAAGVLATVTLETRALAGAVLHVRVGTVGDGGQLAGTEVLDVPGVAGGGALASLAVGLVAAVALGGGVVGELLHEVLEVVVLGVGVAVDRAEAVLGFLLGVFVDETAGVDGGHVGVVEGLDGAEGTGVGVAAVLGEAGIEVSMRASCELCEFNLQERNAVVAVLLDLLVPAGLLEGRRVTPRVVVESVEVAALVVGAAVHVLGHLEAVALDIGGGVTDGDLAVATAADVLPQVTSDGLDVGRAVAGLVIVNDLVTGEEEEGVVVVCEGVNGGEQALEVDLVV